LIGPPPPSAWPSVAEPPPGPRSRELSLELALYEAPGVNTVAEEGPSIVWEEAWGANVRDVDGNVYVDLTAGFGVAAVGHRHPRVVEAVTAQAGRLLHGLGDVSAHPLRPELAARLAALAPVAGPPADPAQVFFSISGAEAVEIALKTALAATGRPGVAAFEPSYHGLTLGALAVSSRAHFREPFADHLHHHVHRFPFGGPTALLAATLASGTVGAVIVEPVVGREGILFPPAGWLAEVAALCRETGTLLVADEIFTGFGRTGILFAVEAEGVRPDLICCGKALGGGLPIAAVLARRSLFAAWRTDGEARHTSTFLAHPLACAAALAVLDILEEERLVERSAGLGRQLGPRLAGWPSRFPGVTAVRGRGLLWGVELAAASLAHRFTQEARSRGVLILAGGADGRVAQIVPPLAIGSGLLEHALGLLEAALEGNAGTP
jgi:4-aminobutyrate aminotransferase-like enzyme